MDCLGLTFNIINKYKLCIIILWPLLTIVCVYWAFDLTTYAQFNFLPPSGTDSDIAYQKVGQYFPNVMFQDTEMILMEISNPIITNIENNDTRKIFNTLNDSIWHKINDENGGIIEQFGYLYEFPDSIDNTPFYPYIRSSFINNDNTLLLSFITSNANGLVQEQLNDYIDDIIDECNRLSNENYTLTLTGGLTMWKESMEIIQSDMTSKDIILMPVIFIFMCYVIGSWKLIGIPASNLGFAIVISQTTYLPFAKYNWLELNPLAPSIMMFLCMALSVDYSLFMLSRFASERRKGIPVEESVKEMLRYSGHVVLLSGLVLIICYIGIAFFPVTGMNTVAYGASIAILYAIVINFTFTTATILQFPKFYGNLEVLPSCCIKYLCCCCRNHITKYNDKYNTPLIDSNENNDSNSPAKVKTLGIKDSKSPVKSSLGSMSDQNDLMFNRLNSSISDSYKNMTKSEILAYEEKERNDLQHNCYFKLTKITTSYPYKYIIPCIVYILMIPAILTLFHFEYSMDFTMYFPKGTDSVNAYDTIVDNFPVGLMSPIFILSESKENDIWNQGFFNGLCQCGKDMIKGKDDFTVPSTSMKSVTFVPYVDQKHVIHEDKIICMRKQSTIDAYETFINDPYNVSQSNLTAIIDTIETILNVTIPPNISESEFYYDFIPIFYTFVSDDQKAALVQIVPPFNGYIGSSVTPANNLRDIGDSLNDNPKTNPYANFYVHSAIYWNIDSMNDTYAKLPWVLTGIILVVFIIIGFMFKVVFLPLRLFFAVVIPIAFVYGCCVGIYQIGWLDGLNISSFHSSDSGLIWMLPVVTVTILIGLAMDYEIFLFSRVFEYRKKGFTTQASIILAVSSTGPIISSCGIVMALAFAGLLLQNIVSSNQMGFLFVFGVLIDTFIIRPFLVPSILAMADQLNWWPTKVPMIGLKNEYGKIILNDNTIINDII